MYDFIFTILLTFYNFEIERILSVIGRKLVNKKFAKAFVQAQQHFINTGIYIGIRC